MTDETELDRDRAACLSDLPFTPADLDKVWALPDGQHIVLLQPYELDKVPAELRLISISGRVLDCQPSELDRDTRRGVTAWGALK